MTDSKIQQISKTIISKFRLISASRRRTVIAGLAATILLVLVLSILIKAAGSSGSDTNLNTFAVRRDNLAITVTESGSIKARNTIDLKSEVEGQVTIISIVDEGTYITPEDVEKGKVLVELDSSNLTEQLAQREIDFTSAEASHAEAKEEYDIQVKQNESDVTAADLKVRFGLMDLQKYLGAEVAESFISKAVNTKTESDEIASLINDPRLGGEALQKLRELKDNITLAKSKYEKASDKLDWTRKLYKNEYVSETDLKADELEVESLDIQVKKAESAEDLFTRYEFPKEAEKYLSDYKEAIRELGRTNARARSKLAQADARLKSAASRFNLQKDRLDKIKKQLDACIIRAPAPGLVVYGSSGDFWRRRNEPIEEGATVYERQKIIELPDTSEMMVEIDVHESSVDKVRPGQSARIIIDAFPDQTFQGKVLKVSPLPDPQRGWLNPDLKVYTTEVTIDGSHSFLKPGMSAKVEVLVEQLDDVLIVPVQVVANREGTKVCYCLTSGGVEQREVRTGSFNDTFVQIIDGLQAGDEVLMNPPRLVEPTAVAKGKEGPKKTGDAAKEPRKDRAKGAQAGEISAERARNKERERKPRNDSDRMKQFQNLSEEEKAKLKQRFENMSDEEKKQFMAKMREGSNQQVKPKQD